MVSGQILTIGGYMRLLYAEDEPDLNRIVTKKLAEEGFSVIYSLQTMM